MFDLKEGLGKVQQESNPDVMFCSNCMYFMKGVVDCKRIRTTHNPAGKRKVMHKYKMIFRVSV